MWRGEARDTSSLMWHIEISCERYGTRGFFSVFFAINPSSGQGDYTHSKHIIKAVPGLSIVKIGIKGNVFPGTIEDVACHAIRSGGSTAFSPNSANT
jgi:hypothetical protein